MPKHILPNILVFDILIVGGFDILIEGSSFIKQIHQKGHSSEILRVSRHKRREAKFGIKSIKKKAFPRSKEDSWNNFIFGGNIAKKMMVLSSDGLFEFDLRSNQWDLVTRFGTWLL